MFQLPSSVYFLPISPVSLPFLYHTTTLAFSGCLCGRHISLSSSLSVCFSLLSVSLSLFQSVSVSLSFFSFCLLGTNVCNTITGNIFSIASLFRVKPNVPQRLGFLLLLKYPFFPPSVPFIFNSVFLLSDSIFLFFFSCNIQEYFPFSKAHTEMFII